MKSGLAMQSQDKPGSHRLDNADQPPTSTSKMSKFQLNNLQQVAPSSPHSLNTHTKSKHALESAAHKTTALKSAACKSALLELF